MRPQSIIMFERLFLASLAVSAIMTVISYDDILRELITDPGIQQLGLGSGFLIGILAVSFALYLLLWYLIALKAANVAKWILVVLVALGALFSIPAMIQASIDVTTLVNFAALALEVVSVGYLFRADAVAWLKGQPEADPAAFD